MGVNSVDDICITGGRPLYGEITIQGSKNAALPMMAAALLHRGISVLAGCPKIDDVFCMEKILCCLGAVTWWEGQDLYLDCREADRTQVPGLFTGKMRSSVILLGVLLARNKEGQMGYPGGCVIGKRPIDLHFMVLEKMGATIEEQGSDIRAFAKELTGNHIVFPKKSVGATEQGILAAVTARGETVLKNCACEPEIKWLCSFLRTMGADICGDGSDTITIRGKEGLEAGNMRVPPDRIVTGTYICAAAVTGGEILIRNPPEGELSAFLEVYRKMGGQYKRKSGKLLVSGSGCKNPVPYLETGTYPGFPTDLQSQVMTVLSLAFGESHIREQIFEDRFKTAGELNRMGACIRIKGRDAYISGRDTLKGCRVQARELRGGAALVLAGLAAQGTTCIHGYSYIRRGYEHICEDLCSLGACIL